MKQLRSFILDWERARSSIALRCLGVMVLFSVLLLALVLGIGKIADFHISNTLPSLSTVIKHSDELERDDFSKLSVRELDNCEIVIFDEDGNQLYVSSPLAADHIDFDVVANMNANEVMEYELTVNTNSNHAINNNVASELSEGVLNKYDYTNSSGEKRILACVLPVVTESALHQAASSIKQIWLLAIPTVLLLMITCASLITYIIRKGIRPLDAAIETYRTSGEMPVDAGIVSTELQVSLDAFSRLACQLDDELNDKRRLMATASHDLKSPLTVIRGFAQALDDGVVSPDKQQEYIKAIIKRATMVTELIDSLFSYATLGHPDFTPNCTVQDIACIVCDVVEYKKLEVEQLGCSIECKVDQTIEKGSLAAYIDEVLVVRLLDNLIGNACKHNPRGTHIRVWCGCENNMVTIRVADDGCGISDKLREHIFEPFVSNEDGRSSGECVGLGLAIAQRCAVSCGGSIRFEENPEQPFNTEIVVSYPAQPE